MSDKNSSNAVNLIIEKYQNELQKSKRVYFHDFDYRPFLKESIFLFDKFPQDDEAILFCVDQSKENKPNGLFVTHKQIVIISNDESRFFAFDSINQISFNEISNCLEIDNELRFSFELDNNESKIICEYLLELKNNQIEKLYFKSDSTFKYLIADVEDSYETQEIDKYYLFLQKLYLKIDDKKDKAKIETRIQEFKRKRNLVDSWSFFDENSKKYFTSSNIEDIKSKLLNKHINPHHLCMKNSIGEKKLIEEYLAESEDIILDLFQPLNKYLRFSYIPGMILGFLIGILYLIFEKEWSLDTDMVGQGLILILAGIVGIGIERTTGFILLGIGGIIAIIVGIIYLLITLGPPVLTALGIALGIAIVGGLLGLLVGWILYIIFKPQKLSDLWI